MKNSTLSLHSNNLGTVVRWAIVLALAVLLISMASGQSGVSNYLSLKENRDNLKQVVDELRVENQNLQEKIKRIRSDRYAQLRYLKDQFGVVEAREVIYRFQDHPLLGEPGHKNLSQAFEAGTARSRMRQK